MCTCSGPSGATVSVEIVKTILSYQVVPLQNDPVSIVNNNKAGLQGSSAQYVIVSVGLGQ